MAESTLALTKAQLQASCGTYAGWGRDPADWADDDKAAIIKEATDSGCRRVYYPEPLEGETVSHSWSFMRPTSDIPLVEGATSCVLPDTFGSFEGNLTIVTTVSTVAQPWKITWENEGRIRERYAVTPEIIGPPMYVCPIPLSGTTGTQGQRFELLVFPMADQDYMLRGTFYVNPNCLSDAFPYVLGGAQHAETFLESCLAIMEERLDDQSAVHTRAFQKRLAASISIDRRGRPQRIGYNQDSSDNSDWNRGNMHYYAPAATYNGNSLG